MPIADEVTLARKHAVIYQNPTDSGPLRHVHE